MFISTHQTAAAAFCPFISAASPQMLGLKNFEDLNNWLGRSQFSNDPFGRFVYDEFRIYDRALDGSEIVRLLKQGADNP